MGARRGFAKPEIYDALEQRDVDYAIRMPANKNLELEIEDSHGRRSVSRMDHAQNRRLASEGPDQHGESLGRVLQQARPASLDNPVQPLVLPPRVGVPPARLVKTGGRLVKHARYYWLLLAEGHLTRRLFGDMLRRIWALPGPGG